MERYVEALKQEYQLVLSAYGEPFAFKTIFVGGGTPTALPDTAFKSLMTFIQALPKTLDYEWTVEANPESLSTEKLKIMKAAGCNRLSIGVQDLNETILKRIGRLHTAEDFKDAFSDARALGFDNISVDLMFGIPGQTLEGFKTTLKDIIALSPEHISTYSLKIEEGTVMAHLVEKGHIEPLSDEMDRLMYHEIISVLSDNNYEQYELSNFSRENHESRHNLSYWHNESFLALGLSSSYYVLGTRFENVHELDRYFKNIEAGHLPILTRETNGIDTERYETLFLQLRLSEGLDVMKFSQRYGIDFDQIYGSVVKRLIGEGLMAQKDDVLTLTERGKDLSNSVFVDLMI
jgi:oxygen-independent coproporphyrinogen-3 oxidase